MLKVGITGGIGSGKSLVCRLFGLLGIPTYDADTRARWLMRSDPELQKELKAAFGPDTYTASGELNRIYLAGVVFQDQERLDQLNRLVHPRVGEDFIAWAKDHRHLPYVIKEAALLFESGSYRDLDRVITVAAPQELRITRTLLRDPHRTQADVEAIIRKQLPEEERQALAHHVLYNDDQQLVIPQVLALDAIFSMNG
jgi:dephospho-CoA kinase